MTPEQEKIIQNLFVASEDQIDPGLAVNRLAVNEEGVVGFITKVKKIKNVLVFVGFEISNIKEWISLSPIVLNTKLEFRSILEICHILEDRELESPIKNIGISVSTPTSISNFPGPLDFTQWSKVDLSIEDKENFKNFMQKFLFPDSPPKNPPFSENDFKIDNENDEDENI